MSPTELAVAAAARWGVGPCHDVVVSSVAAVWIGADVVVRVVADTPAAAHTEQLAQQLAAEGAPVQRLAGLVPVTAHGWRVTAWRRCAGTLGLRSYADGCAWAAAIRGLHRCSTVVARPGRGLDAEATDAGRAVHAYVQRCAPHLLETGVSHQDAHSQNVFVCAGRATLVDLDTLATAPLWWDALELVCEDDGRVAADVVAGAHATLGLGVLPDEVVAAARELRRAYAADGR